MSKTKANNEQQPGFKLKGWHVLAGWIGFFAIVITTDIVMVNLAVSTFGGLSTSDAYRKGLRYNDRLAEERSMDRLGLSATVDYDVATQTMSLALVDAGGQPVSDASVTAMVGRPATNVRDERLTLRQGRDGVYRAGWESSGPGSWIVSTRAEHNGKTLLRTKTRICVERKDSIAEGRACGMS